MQEMSLKDSWIITITVRPPISASLLSLHELRSWKSSDRLRRNISLQRSECYGLLPGLSRLLNGEAHTGGHQSNTRVLFWDKILITEEDRTTLAKYSLVHECTGNSSSSLLRLVRQFSPSNFLAGFSSTKNVISSLSRSSWEVFPLLLLRSRRDAILILENFIGKVCLYMLAQLFRHFLLFFVGDPGLHDCAQLAPRARQAFLRRRRCSPFVEQWVCYLHATTSWLHFPLSSYLWYTTGRKS